MKASFPVLIKRLRPKGIIKAAAMHNLREIANEIGVDGHIDPYRIGDNIILRGENSAEAVAARARLLMSNAGIVKLRVDAVRGLELIFTLPSDNSVNMRQYFEDATNWAEAYYAVPVLSSVVHLDESHPHCHVMLLPLLNGRMVGSDLHGHASKLRAMQASFYEQVSSKYGFVREPPKKRYTLAQRKMAIRLAREKLQANSALTDIVIDELLKPHIREPGPLLLKLGLQVPDPPTKKSFVAIMIQPAKPEVRNPIGGLAHNPIGSVSKKIHSFSEPYSCVGF